MANTLQFKAVIEINGINPYVLVRSRQAVRLHANWRKPMPVTVQINGQPNEPWHINMMPTGNGDFYLYLHNDVRKASNTQVGDTVEVLVRFDVEYQSGPTHAMPHELQQAIDTNPVVAQQWDLLPPSRQKEVLRYIAGLKSEAARQRNIQKAINVLGGSPEKFLGRVWPSANTGRRQRDTIR